MVSKVLVGVALLLVIAAAALGGEYRSWTQAVCNSNNYCEDYKITIREDEITFEPTGFAVQHKIGWKDPRSVVIVAR